MNFSVALNKGSCSLADDNLARIRGKSGVNLESLACFSYATGKTQQASLTLYPWVLNPPKGVGIKSMGLFEPGEQINAGGLQLISGATDAANYFGTNVPKFSLQLNGKSKILFFVFYQRPAPVLPATFETKSLKLNLLCGLKGAANLPNCNKYKPDAKFKLRVFDGSQELYLNDPVDTKKKIDLVSGYDKENYLNFVISPEMVKTWATKGALQFRLDLSPAGLLFEGKNEAVFTLSYDKKELFTENFVLQISEGLEVHFIDAENVGVASVTSAKIADYYASKKFATLNVNGVLDFNTVSDYPIKKMTRQFQSGSYLFEGLEDGVLASLRVSFEGSASLNYDLGDVNTKFSNFSGGFKNICTILCHATVKEEAGMLKRVLVVAVKKKVNAQEDLTLRLVDGLTPVDVPNLRYDYSKGAKIIKIGSGFADDFYENSNGHYLIKKIAPGEYNLEIQLDGYQKVILNNIATGSNIEVKLQRLEREVELAIEQLPAGNREALAELKDRLSVQGFTDTSGVNWEGLKQSVYSPQVVQIKTEYASASGASQWGDGSITCNLTSTVMNLSILYPDVFRKFISDVEKKSGKYQTIISDISNKKIYGNVNSGTLKDPTWQQILWTYELVEGFNKAAEGRSADFKSKCSMSNFVAAYPNYTYLQCHSPAVEYFLRKYGYFEKDEETIHLHYFFGDNNLQGGANSLIKLFEDKSIDKSQLNVTMSTYVTSGHFISVYGTVKNEKGTYFIVNDSYGDYEEGYSKTNKDSTAGKYQLYKSDWIAKSSGKVQDGPPYAFVYFFNVFIKLKGPFEDDKKRKAKINELQDSFDKIVGKKASTPSD